MTPHTPPEDTESTTTDEASKSLQSMELPVVVLGQSEEDESINPGEEGRVLRGRVGAKYFIYPMYLLIGLSGAITLYVSWKTKEWSLIPTVMAWSLALAWCRLYALAWRYQRKILGTMTLLFFLLLHAVMILAMFDRAGPQRAARATSIALVERGPLPLLQLGAILLGINVLVMLSHWVWFGRGWRAKKTSR